jgi:hypothetical protein
MPGDEVDAITESAKAVQETAKLGGKALDIGRDAGGWLNRIFGPGIEDAVALHWSDRVRARRVEAAIYDWERLTALFRKVDARLNKKGVTSIRSVPPKIVLALVSPACTKDAACLRSKMRQLSMRTISTRSGRTYLRLVWTPVLTRYKESMSRYYRT